MILNEYAWLWLYPDGEPIDIAKGGFDKIPTAERQEYRFYITAAMTEMWRSERFAIGVLNYQYLGSYLPRKTGPYHFGDFKNITTLQLHPEFETYMTEAFKPLGVISSSGPKVRRAMPGTGTPGFRSAAARRTPSRWC